MGEVFVAAVDVVDVGDFGFAFGGEGGYDHGSAGADVTAGDGDALERSWAGDDGLVFVEDFDVCAHFFEFEKVV